jgi:hypothetical protein
MTIEKIEALAKAIATIQIASNTVQETLNWYKGHNEKVANEKVVNILWNVHNDLFEVSVIMSKELRETRKEVKSL